jgi:heptosyltransferase II
MGYLKSKSPSRVVVRGPNFVGDSVLALPFYQSLRRHFTDSSITLIATPASAELSRSFDCFDVIWSLPDRSSAEVWVMAQKVKASDFSLSISLPSSVSAAMLFFLARVPTRVGWAETLAVPFYTDALHWKGRASGAHKSDLYLELLELLAVRGTLPKIPAKPTAPPVAESDYLVFAPTASIELREWPHSIECISLLRKKYPQLRIKVLGTGGQERWAALLASLSDDKVENCIGKTTLSEAVEICRNARGVVSMDSGMAHLSATLAQAPTVVVFGPGDPAYIAPRGPSVYPVRRQGLLCSPCEKAVCQAPYGYQVCLKELATDPVVEAVEKILG